MNPNIQIDILHRSFKNYFSHHFPDLETLQPFYQRIFPNCHIDKQEFKSNSYLSEKENLILSLWREGNSSDNIFHSYLSFFRIFEFLLFEKKKIKD